MRALNGGFDRLTDEERVFVCGRLIAVGTSQEWLEFLG
jgi:hypothetical protein